jgi:hypothetical protein
MARSSRRLPAVAPFTFAPPLVDERLNEAARDATLDLLPWATYSLGYQVGALPEALRLTSLAPEFGSNCFDAIPSSASVIRLTCDILGPEMPTEVASRIWGAVNDLEEFNNNAAHTFRRSKRFVWDVADSNYLASRIPVLLRSSLPSNSPLLPWLHLGYSLGDFISKDPAPPREDAVPFHPVVAAVRNLPKAERDALPELKELAAIIDRPEVEGEAGLRRAYVARLASNWLSDDLDPWPNSPFFTQEIQSLHRGIDAHLLARKAIAPLPQDDHVPNWDRVTGKLMFGGRLIRQVAPKARTIRPIFDLFQSQRWPASVETNHSGDRKGDVIDSLNDGLRVINSFRSGTTYGIGWRLNRSR